MAGAVGVADGAGPASAGPASAGGERLIWPILRFLAAGLIASGLCLLWWLRTPRDLSGRINIVGYPTVNDYAFAPSITAYRLVVYAFPVFAITAYGALRWRGPLRRRPPIPPVEGASQSEPQPALAPEPAFGPALRPASAAGDPPRAYVGLPLLAPALVVALAFSTSSSSHRSLNPTGLLAGAAYVIGVTLVAAVPVRAEFRARLAATLPIRADFRSRLAAWNACAGSAAAIMALWVVSRRTFVVVVNEHRDDHWTWLPLGVALAGVVLVISWGVWRLARGRAAELVERELLSVVVGGAFVFLATSYLPSAIPRFVGFDDAQGEVGADLLDRGYFPWRDFYFVHGVYQDALQSRIGFGLFETSIWGATAGVRVVLVPLAWVFLYWLVVWRTRAHTWMLVAFLLAFMLPLTLYLDNRFILAPLILLLLGRALGSRRVAPTVGLAALAFGATVLVPESLYLVIPTIVVVVAADCFGRAPGDRWRKTFRRTAAFGVTGVVLTGIWAGYLAHYGALGAFIHYFKVVGPGHNAAGAVPLRVPEYASEEFRFSIVLVLITAWMIGWRLLRRRVWTPQAWVLVAAGGYVALAGEKALGRYDAGHIGEVYTAVIPLGILWAAQAVDYGDRVVSVALAGARRIPLRARTVRRPFAIMLVLALVVQPSGWVGAVLAIPGRSVSVVDDAPYLPRLGYALPDAINVGQLADLKTLLDRYAGPDGTVFDFSNSLGYPYFLLQNRPASKYVHVSLAIPEFTQEEVVENLEKSQPAVVIYQTPIGGQPDHIGLFSWDGVSNPVRHYIVSQYLLDGWVPIVSANGILLLLRRDLVASAAPLPDLGARPVTDDLYFTAASACNWAAAPNFLTPAPSGRSVRLPVHPLSQRTEVVATGWAFDRATADPGQIVIATGSTVQPTVVVRQPSTGAFRADGQAALGSGFRATAVVPVGSGPVTVLAIGRDQRARVIATQAGAATLRGPLRSKSGRTIVLATAGGSRAASTPGRLDSVGAEITYRGELILPADFDPTDYQLATFRAATDFGRSTVVLSDVSPSPQGHLITAVTLPQSRRALQVRVGSCLAWHGYRGRTLYLTKQGGPPITEVELAAIR